MRRLRSRPRLVITMAIITCMMLAMSTITAATTAAAAGKVVTPESFGAIGDAKTDSTKALQNALDSLGPNNVLKLARGKTYLHSDVLRITKAGSRITGPGTLKATNEERSAVRVMADNVTLDHLTLAMGTTSKRWMANEQMKLHLDKFSNIKVTNVVIDGSAAAGVFVSGADHFSISKTYVRNSRADGIHMTNGSHDGTVDTVWVKGAGDDGVAVVSYKSDGVICRNIVINNPAVSSNTHGRGVSVVGGDHITYKNVRTYKTDAAGIYIANEGNPYFTYASSNVNVLDATLSGSNTGTTTQHGSVVIYSAQPGSTVSNVVMQNIKITGTRTSAPREVGIVTDGGSVANIKLDRFTIYGSGPTPFSSMAPASAVTRTGWKTN